MSMEMLKRKIVKVIEGEGLSVEFYDLDHLVDAIKKKFVRTKIKQYNVLKSRKTEDLVEKTRRLDNFREIEALIKKHFAGFTTNKRLREIIGHLSLVPNKEIKSTQELEKYKKKPVTFRWGRGRVFEWKNYLKFQIYDRRLYEYRDDLVSLFKIALNQDISFERFNKKSLDWQAMNNHIMAKFYKNGNLEFRSATKAINLKVIFDLFKKYANPEHFIYIN
jgi:hypothetical protein